MGVEVGDKFILHSTNELEYEVHVINVNEYRPPEMKYMVDIYHEGKLVCGDEFVGDYFYRKMRGEKMKYNENKTTVNGGIGFVGLLTIVFIALKLLGYIKWSWVWVLSPIWIELLLVIIGFVIYAVVVLIISNSRKRKAERYKRAREAMEKAKGAIDDKNT